MTNAHLLRIAAVLACLLLAVTPVHAAVGQDQMQKANEALVNADTKSALQYLDQAINAMESAGVIRGSDNDLAGAYYLKANILLSRAVNPAVLEELLNKAVKAAPAFVPEKKLISDPRINRIYTKVLSSHNAQGQAAVDLAQQLFAQEKYCDVITLLDPFQNAYGDRKVLGERLFSMSQTKCVSAEDTTKNVERLTTVLKTNTRRCGIFPVQINNLPGKPSLPSNYTADRLLKQLSSMGADLKPQLLDADVLDRWQRKFKISNLNEIVSKAGMIRFGWSLADLFKGESKGLDASIGGLPQRYENALASLMEQEGLQFAMVVLVEASESSGSSGFGNSPDANILLNIYAAPDIQKPAIREHWRSMSELIAQDRFDKIGNFIKANLSKLR